ncbi:hypothetical protein FACS189494_08630 [Spirochaetia bacterium]|nr:hypothetical protein FACS189494_08630 [Spirochaetia bacterium]
MKKYYFVIAILVSVLLGSCSGAAGKLKLAEGNFHYSRGKFVEAISAYMTCLQYKETASYAQYALGSTYLAMEQSEPALARFAAAEMSAGIDNRELLYRIRYNTGIVRFKSGDFIGAANDFKRALEADSSRLQAKINLELSVLSLMRKNESAQIRTTEKGSIEEETQRRKREILFNYVREKETNKWKSWEWTGETNNEGPDY